DRHSPALATCPEESRTTNSLRSHAARPHQSPSVSNGDLRCPSAVTSAAKALGFRRSRPFAHERLRCVLCRASTSRLRWPASRAAAEGSARERPRRQVQTAAALPQLHLGLVGGCKCK